MRNIDPFTVDWFPIVESDLNNIGNVKAPPREVVEADEDTHPGLTD
jgi:hypothetical protein